MALLNLFHRQLLLSALLLSTTSAFAGVTSLFDPIKFSNPENNFHVRVQSFFANDAVSIQTRLHKMRGDIDAKEGDNLEIIDVRIDSGIYSKYTGYIGYTHREESAKIASKDMEELYHSVRNKNSMTIGREYNLKLLVDSFKANGVVLANSFPIYKSDTLRIKIGGALELLQANVMQDWELSGNAKAVGKKDYDYNVVSRNNYTHNYLYRLDVPKSSATGYGFHFSLDANYKNFQLSLIANDIFAQLDWKLLPYSYVKMNTDNKTYDKNGYVRYNPSISGIEKEMDYTQHLIEKYRIEAKYSVSKSIFEIGLDHMYFNYLPYISYIYNFSKNWSAKLDYESRFGSYYGEVKYKDIFVGLRASSLEEQHVVALNLGIGF